MGWKNEIMPSLSAAYYGRPQPQVSPQGLLNVGTGAQRPISTPALIPPASKNKPNLIEQALHGVGSMTTFMPRLMSRIGILNGNPKESAIAGAAPGELSGLIGSTQEALGFDPAQSKLLSTLTQSRSRLENDKTIPDSIKQVYLGLIDGKITKLTTDLQGDPTSDPAENNWVKMVQGLAAQKQASINDIAAKYGPDMSAIIDSSSVNDRYKTQYKTLLPILQAKLQAQTAGTAQDDILKYLMSLGGFIPGTQPAPINTTGGIPNLLGI